ncbi:hypothetical protein BpHYR1_004538 [Brachionus plicatilis]|uniref:Uncharacterized protein n=1 Tax=Brachionus plicatilis TaxID=10195 RepID=A0A3M7PX90_BRAPC|nr:hypothetical protein BpHYR1_004538 [Brachionus plicatilis]
MIRIRLLVILNPDPGFSSQESACQENPCFSLRKSGAGFPDPGFWDKLFLQIRYTESFGETALDFTFLRRNICDLKLLLGAGHIIVGWKISLLNIYTSTTAKFCNKN